MNEHREAREALGAYVLGALEPGERRRLEDHLEGCPSCRDELSRLSSLPSLLDHLTSQEATEASMLRSPRLSVNVAATTLHEGGRLRRQVRGWRVATALTAAAAAAMLLAWSPWSGGRSLDRWVFTPTTVAAGVDGTAAALAWEWGTTLELDLDDLPPADRYVVWAVAGDGRREQAGTWGRTASGHATVRGASAILRGELAVIEVALPGGPVLATFDVVPPV